MDTNITLLPLLSWTDAVYPLPPILLPGLNKKWEKKSLAYCVSNIGPNIFHVLNL